MEQVDKKVADPEIIVDLTNLELNRAVGSLAFDGEVVYVSEQKTDEPADVESTYRVCPFETIKSDIEHSSSLSGLNAERIKQGKGDWVSRKTKRFS